MAGRSLHGVKRHLEYKSLVRTRSEGMNRPEAIDGGFAHMAVKPHQLLIGKTEVGFSNRRQAVALGGGCPHPEGEV